MLLSDIMCEAMFSWGSEVRMGLDIFAELGGVYLVLF